MLAHFGNRYIVKARNQDRQCLCALQFGDHFVTQTHRITSRRLDFKIGPHIHEIKGLKRIGKGRDALPLYMSENQPPASRLAQGGKIAGMDRPCSVAGPFECVVMNKDAFVIGTQRHIALDPFGAAGTGNPECGNGVFRCFN